MKFIPDILRHEAKQLPNRVTVRLIIWRSLGGVFQIPFRLKIQEPDIVVNKVWFQYRCGKLMNEPRLGMQLRASSRLPTATG